MTPLLLIGGGGHCLSVIEVLESIDAPVGGVVHGPGCVCAPVGGYPALGHDDDLARLRERFDAALVTVGQIKSPSIRQRLYACLRELDFRLPTIVASTAYCAHSAELGEGTVVLHKAMVNAAALVGHNGIVNSCALVEHGVVLGNHCHVATGAVVCGDAKIGDGSFIGAGAVVREGVVIGENCVIGMGTRVWRDVPAHTVFI